MDIEKILRKYQGELQETIFKELMHYEILESVFSINEIKNTLVFQGGTALRLCYSINRYSEDLDFAINKDKKFEKDFMTNFKGIFTEKIVQKYNLEAEIIEPRYNNGAVVQKWIARIYLPNFKRKSKINLEIANIPSYDNSFSLLKDNYKDIINKDIFLNVESVNEIFIDKLLALALREYIKFRDFWDIHWLGINYIKEPNYDLLRAKITDYKLDTKTYFIKLKQKEEQIKNTNLEKDFLFEMRRFLYPELYKEIKSYNFYNTIKNSILRVIEKVKNEFSTEQERATEKQNAKRIRKEKI